MDNKTIRITVLPQYDLFEIEKVGNGEIIVIGGYERNLLQMLLQSLKTPYKISVPEDSQWGAKLPDGNWTGLMGMMARNETDVVIGRIFLTQVRAEAFDYSYPYDLDVATFAAAEPEIIYSPLTFILPFDPQLWIAVATTVVLLALLMKIIMTKRFSLQSSFVHVLSGLLKQPICVEASKLHDRFFITAVLFGMLFISTGYSAVLLSFLTVPFREAGVRDIETLSREVERGKMKIYSPQKFLVPHILREHPDSTVRALMDKLLKNNWFLKMDSEFLREKIIREKNALLATAFYYRLLLGQKHYIISPEKLTILPQTIFMRKNLTWRDEIDKFVHVFYASGMYKEAVDRHFFRKEKHFEDVHHDLKWKITLEQMKGVFLCLLISYVLSICVLFIEILHFRLTKKKK